MNEREAEYGDRERDLKFTKEEEVEREGTSLIK